MSGSLSWRDSKTAASWGLSFGAPRGWAYNMSAVPRERPRHTGEMAGAQSYANRAVEVNFNSRAHPQTGDKSRLRSSTSEPFVCGLTLRAVAAFPLQRFYRASNSHARGRVYAFAVEESLDRMLRHSGLAHKIPYGKLLCSENQASIGSVCSNRLA